MIPIVNVRLTASSLTKRAPAIDINDETDHSRQIIQRDGTAITPARVAMLGITVALLLRYLLANARAS
jgi:hypothetical protein